MTVEPTGALTFTLGDDAVARDISHRKSRVMFVDNARLPGRMAKYTERGFDFHSEWRERWERWMAWQKTQGAAAVRAGSHSGWGRSHWRGPYHGWGGSSDMGSSDMGW